MKNLLDYLAAGDSLDQFLDDFPAVKREQAVAALELAGDLLTAGAHLAREPEPRRSSRVATGSADRSGALSGC